MSENNCEERLILDKATNPEGTPAEWQGLTVTYRDALERHTYRQQYNKTAYPLCRILQEGTTIYRFYPEFTDNGRIHYHGIYKPSTKYKALKMYEKLRKTGYIKIERKVATQWHDYIQKDYKDTCKLIGLLHTVVDNDLYKRIEELNSIRRKTMEQFIESKETDII